MVALVAISWSISKQKVIRQSSLLVLVNLESNVQIHHLQLLPDPGLSLVPLGQAETVDAVVEDKLFHPLHDDFRVFGSLPHLVSWFDCRPIFFLLFSTWKIFPFSLLKWFSFLSDFLSVFSARSGSDVTQNQENHNLEFFSSLMIPNLFHYDIIHSV